MKAIAFMVLVVTGFVIGTLSSAKAESVCQPDRDNRAPYTGPDPCYFGCDDDMRAFQPGPI